MFIIFYKHDLRDDDDDDGDSVDGERLRVHYTN